MLAVFALLVIVGVIVLYFLLPGASFKLLAAVERGAAGFKQHSIRVGGLHMEYLQGGEGGRDDALVLLHGFGADKDHWTRVGKYLSKHFWVIAPDLPGFGESSADPDIDYTISAQVERLKAFTAALGIKTFHLGGSSMGGNIAGAYASRFPDAIKSLLLIAPGGVSACAPSELDRLLEAGKPNPLVAKSPAGYDHLLNFVFYKKPFLPGAIKKHFMHTAIERQALNGRIFEQVHDNTGDSPPLEALVDGLFVPTLIVWGKNDRLLHVSGAEILKNVMPQARTAILDQVGHLPMIEKPKETAALYLGLLGK